MKAKKEKLVRIYPGVRKDQKILLDKEARILKMQDGETVRHIFDFYFKNKDKISNE